MGTSRDNHMMIPRWWYWTSLLILVLSPDKKPELKVLRISPVPITTIKCSVSDLRSIHVKPCIGRLAAA